ncbi:hypothetical protein C8Q75DRAFT_736326 [Abortiporus biennis]|nr:hypothetical protein C8Q75DRAFT_736326 [Abortiporus biennis]
MWFDDGTIVLRAEDTIFRVYGGQLSRYSPVLKKIFLEQPRNPGPGGLYTSRYEDYMLAFLLAIFDIESCMEMKTLHRWNADSFASVLRLSTKYEVKVLLHQVLSALSETFHWSFPRFKKSAFYTLNQEDVFAGELFALANVVRETHATLVLPHLLYLCCRMGSGNILEGGLAGPSGRRVKLNSENTMSVLIGQRFLNNNVTAECIKKLRDHEVLPGHVNCVLRRKRNCRNNMIILMLGASSSPPVPGDFHDLLLQSPDHYSRTVDEASACISCAKVGRRGDGEVNIWSSLLGNSATGIWYSGGRIGGRELNGEEKNREDEEDIIHSPKNFDAIVAATT